MPQVAVVGGGIAGLSAAYELTKAGVDVMVLEASPRLGGKIVTERTGGAVIEGGPDSFITVKPTALALARELGLKTVATNKENTDIYVFARGRLRRLPDGLFLMAPKKIAPFLRSDLFTWPGKLRMGLDLVLPRRKAEDDESLGDFARRRLGAEALDVLVQPIMAGIYGGDADRLSIRSTFPRFPELERRHGSLIRGIGRGGGHRPAGETLFMSLAGGLDGFVSALEAKIGRHRIRLSCPVGKIAKNGSGWTLETRAGAVSADKVIVTTLARLTADLVKDVDHELSRLLASFSTTSTATVSLLYEAGDLPPLPRGFGFVVAKSEVRTISAGTFTTQKFPGRSGPGMFLIRCFVGGAGHEDAVLKQDPELLSQVRADLKRIAGIEAEPKTARIFKWIKANPQYEVGHEEKLKRVESLLLQHPGLHLAGASYRGLGIPDCMQSGIEAALRAKDPKNNI